MGSTARRLRHTSTSPTYQDEDADAWWSEKGARLLRYAPAIDVGDAPSQWIVLRRLCVGGWSGIREPRRGLAERRPACRAATVITASDSPADNASVVDACVSARHPNRVAIPALHSYPGTSGSPYYTHVADYKDTFRRTRDAASRRKQLARHMPLVCTGTSVILLYWTPEKKHAVQRLLTRTAIQPCYTCPRSPSSCVSIRPCVNFEVPLLIGAYVWR